MSLQIRVFASKDWKFAESLPILSIALMIRFVAIRSQIRNYNCCLYFYGERNLEAFIFIHDSLLDFVGKYQR